MVSSLKQTSKQEYSGVPVEFDLAQSFNLRLLVHYIGDIHQPLHTVSRYDSKDFAEGDRGGNLFEVSTDDK